MKEKINLESVEKRFQARAREAFNLWLVDAETEGGLVWEQLADWAHAYSMAASHAREPRIAMNAYILSEYGYQRSRGENPEMPGRLRRFLAE